MSEEQSNNTRSPDDKATTVSKPLTRRDLLRRTAVSMPMVLTLQSGAALARSSNLISATSTDYADADGRTLCLDKDSVFAASDSADVYDLGDPPYARVYAIRDREYYNEPRRRSGQLSEAEMCRSGRSGFLRPRDHDGRGWKEVKVPKGVLVSATALSSFAGDIHIYDL